MNRKTISKIASLMTVVCFVGFMALAMVLTALGHKEATSYYENRNLAEFPTAARETILDGSYFSGIDTYISDHSAGRKAILALKAAIDTYVIRRPVVNEVVIGKDLLLPFNNYEVTDKNYIEEMTDSVAQNLKRHSDTAESYGGKFYFIAVPCQYVCYEDSYPWYLNNRSDYTRASSSALFDKLNKNGINYIDMLDFYNKNGKPEEFTSTVDNHFSILGAFDTYNELIKRINADTGLKPHILTKEDFEVTRLDNEYLGSRTRKLFGLWKSDERLYTMMPKTQIPITEMQSYGTIIDPPTMYPHSIDQKGRVNYNLYMGGDIAETVVKTDRNHLPDIFIYGDSFTNGVECVAWTGFDTMYSVDYRHYGAMDVDEYIRKYKPDVVVCIRDYENMLTPWDNGK